MFKYGQENDINAFLFTKFLFLYLKDSKLLYFNNKIIISHNILLLKLIFNICKSKSIKIS